MRSTPNSILALGLVFGLSTIVFSGQAVALTGDLTNDPAGIVKKYLSLDKKGVRLQALSYEAIRPYVEWEEEPSWGQVVVILDYSVSNDIQEWNVISSTEAIIPVTFEIIGLMHWEAATFLLEKRTETIGIRVRAVLNHWRITAPMFPPHVGRKRLIDFVRLAMLKESHEERKSILKRLHTSLKDAKS